MIRQAFTLVELLIVIAIMAIIAAISVPSFRDNQALDEASQAVSEIENVFDELRSDKLLNRKCVPTQTIDGIVGSTITVNYNSGSTYTYEIIENPHFANVPVLFVSADKLSLGCGVTNTLEQYNIVREYDLTELGRIDVDIYMYSEDSEDGLLKVGEQVDFDGQSLFFDKIALLLQQSGFGAEFENQEMNGRDLRFNIKIPGSDYERTVCFYGQTLLSTNSNGPNCEQPIDPNF